MFRVVNVHPRSYDPGIRKGTIVERLYKTQSARFRSSSSNVESPRSPFMQKETRDSMTIDRRRRLVPLTRAFTHEKAAVFFSTIAVGRQSRRTVETGLSDRSKNTYVSEHQFMIHEQTRTYTGPSI